MKTNKVTGLHVSQSPRARQINPNKVMVWFTRNSDYTDGKVYFCSRASFTRLLRLIADTAYITTGGEE